MDSLVKYMLYDPWVQELIKSLINGHKQMDPASWALPNPYLLDPLISDLWFSRIKNFKKKASERGIGYRQMADKIMGPACIRKEIRWAIWGGKLRDSSQESILEVLNFYKGILESRTPNDMFCLRSSFWHSTEDVNRIMRESRWQDADPPRRNVIGALSANCPPVTWGLFTDFFYHRAYELYGLYRLRDNQCLMIRQYGPFRAQEIWQHSENFSINTITIKCIYDNLSGDFDYINHFTTKDSIPTKLLAYSVEIDGTNVNELNELKSANTAVIEMAVRQDKYLKALDEEGQKHLTVLAKYYALKELFVLTGDSWYPEDEVLKRVRNPMLSHFSHANNSLHRMHAIWRFNGIGYNN